MHGRSPTNFRLILPFPVLAASLPALAEVVSRWSECGDRQRERGCRGTDGRAGEKPVKCNNSKCERNSFATRPPSPQDTPCPERGRVAARNVLLPSTALFILFPTRGKPITTLRAAVDIELMARIRNNTHSEISPVANATAERIRRAEHASERRD